VLSEHCIMGQSPDDAAAAIHQVYVSGPCSSRIIAIVNCGTGSRPKSKESPNRLRQHNGCPGV
jgi:hypothetical protein